MNIKMALPAVLIRFLQLSTVYVVRGFIFTHFNYFLLLFFGEYIACETIERESRLFLFRNIWRKNDDLLATPQFEYKKFVLIDWRMIVSMHLLFN